MSSIFQIPPPSVTTYAVVPMSSSDDGWSSSSAMVVNVPFAFAFTREPVSWSAGEPAHAGSVQLKCPCERAKRVWPRPLSTSTRSGAPDATSLAVGDPGPNDTTLPFCGSRHGKCIVDRLLIAQVIPGEEEEQLLAGAIESGAGNQQRASERHAGILIAILRLLDILLVVEPLIGVEHFVELVERKRKLIQQVHTIAGTEYLELLEQFIRLLYDKVQPYGDRV